MLRERLSFIPSFLPSSLPPSVIFVQRDEAVITHYTPPKIFFVCHSSFLPIVFGRLAIKHVDYNLPTYDNSKMVPRVTFELLPSASRGLLVPISDYRTGPTDLSRKRKSSSVELCSSRCAKKKLFHDRFTSQMNIFNSSNFQ